MQALIADFELSEGIYSRAKIEDTNSVCLWLGANVMLEYSCDEVIDHPLLVAFAFSLALSLFENLQANALLKKNLENAKGSLEVLICDLQFLRDQQTITQVNWL
jgi:hypothetical protein